MSSGSTRRLAALDSGALPATDDFESDFCAGLRAKPRSVSPKYFYDARGCALFDAICELPEYYPTRTECAILREHARDMAACIGPGADIVEFGAGAMTKIRIVLDACHEPVRYLPVDIASEHLEQHAGPLRASFPGLEVTPLAADFTRSFALPPPARAAVRRVGFFPGSSIGNFTPDEARRFLAAAARTLRGGGLLIGVDLVKDPAVLHAAYNDAQGITAAFNKNLLERANRELRADFDLAAFDHYAFFNPRDSRIEMHLVSQQRQTVRVADETFEFASGESLHTENSYKYSLESFATLARAAGFTPRRRWCDPAAYFSVHWLEAPTVV
jgi:dimethylhistidine N-methyltransferase